MANTTNRNVEATDKEGASLSLYFDNGVVAIAYYFSQRLFRKKSTNLSSRSSILCKICRLYQRGRVLISRKTRRRYIVFDNICIRRIEWLLVIKSRGDRKQRTKFTKLIDERRTIRKYAPAQITFEIGLNVMYTLAKQSIVYHTVTRSKSRVISECSLIYSVRFVIDLSAKHLICSF